MKSRPMFSWTDDIYDRPNPWEDRTEATMIEYLKDTGGYERFLRNWSEEDLSDLEDAFFKMPETTRKLFLTSYIAGAYLQESYNRWMLNHD